MNLTALIAQIQSQLEQLSDREKINQQEQAATSEKIKQLETKIEEQYRHQSKLDDEAIQIYRQGEELKAKLTKLNRIAALVQEFQNLHTECQDNQELLQTLYSSIPLLTEEESLQIDREQILTNNQQSVDDCQDEQQQPNSDLTPEKKAEKQKSKQDEENQRAQITIQNIKTTLPNAVLLYKQLIASNLERYQTYQNLIIDELDVIWCSVAFIAFGRVAYRQLSFKHHPDLDGSEQAMQLINTAWEISEEYLATRSEGQ